MKILWFELTVPGRYIDDGKELGGWWQDSLERIVRNIEDIELTVAFKAQRGANDVKVIDGVRYIPMSIPSPRNLLDRIKDKWSWEVEAKAIEEATTKVVKEVKPDIIQVFGTEWPYGRVAKFTNIPVVAHIMGIIAPYNNAAYPPMFTPKDLLLATTPWNLKKRIGIRFGEHKRKTMADSEKQIWNHVSTYMGRTEWDRQISTVLHPGRKYYHVEEALRPRFLQDKDYWKPNGKKQITLISTGCTTFWKGPDMMLKTAHILKEGDIDFHWRVAGYMPKHIKRVVERKLGMTFEENNVEFVGFLNQDQLVELLCSSTMYVHTAYIENSPNSICEAQCLGVPIVSTNVGGISTLVVHGVQGELVPANDPWQMAGCIIELASDTDKMLRYSQNSRKTALKRHNDNNIRQQLINCYKEILEDKQN